MGDLISMNEDGFVEELKVLLKKHNVKGHVVLANFEDGQLRMVYDGLNVLEVEGAIQFIIKTLTRKVQIK